MVLLAATGLSSCRSAQPGLTSGGWRGRNVLLVTIDTLRRDRVGAYGGGRLTPTLDRLAAGGRRYDQAFSHAPMTLPAHTSILTGLVPRRHGVRNNTGFRLNDGVATLATALKSAGYRTGAFVGAFVLDARFGLNRGFDVYDDRVPVQPGSSFHLSDRRADDVVKAAGDWVLARPSAGAQPWFTWVHLFDPHTPYDAPPEYRSDRSAYDAEVAYTDAALGRLLDRLQAAGDLANTIVAITADHGESLGEHGETTHGLFAYDATIRVPLIFNIPGAGPAVVTEPAGHADIMPTLLDLVGVAVPARLDGRSLVGPPAADRAVYFEALDASLTRGWAPLRGVVQYGWKYIDLPEAELYDLASDPREQTNRVGRDRHEQVLAATLNAFEQMPEETAAAAAVDADAAARLRALGYVGGAANARRAPGAADDPKRLVALNEQFNNALTASDEGRVPDALAGFAAVLRERPDFLTARTSAAAVLAAAGRPGDAARLLRAAPAEQQSSSALLAKLGPALRDSGDVAGAMTALEAARRGGETLDVLQDLAITYAAAGRADQARALFADLARRYPSTPTVWFNAGLFEMQSRRPQPAADAFRRAATLDSSYAEAWKGLGAALAGSDVPAALDAWRRAAELRPRDYDLLFNLAALSADGPRPADAIPYLRRFISEAPRDRYADDVRRLQQILDRLEGSRR